MSVIHRKVVSRQPRQLYLVVLFCDGLPLNNSDIKKGELEVTLHLT